MKLSEIVSISAGHPFRGKISESQDNDVSVIQMKDISIKSGKICWESLIKAKLTGKKKPNWLNKNDILFMAKGLNNYAVLVDKYVKNVVSSPYFYILRIKTELISPEFLVWQLNQKPLQNYFSKSAEGSRTKNIRRVILEDAEITVPSLSKQESIIKLYKFSQREKAIHEQLIHNSDELMNTIAREIIIEEKNKQTDKSRLH